MIFTRGVLGRRFHLQAAARCNRCCSKSPNLGKVEVEAKCSQEKSCALAVYSSPGFFSCIFIIYAPRSGRSQKTTVIWPGFGLVCFCCFSCFCKTRSNTWSSVTMVGTTESSPCRRSVRSAWCVSPRVSCNPCR